MKEQSDSVLVRRVLDGDTDAFGEIVRQYQPAVYNAALRIVKHADDAADIAQNAFVKAFEKLNTYNPKHKLFSWIYRIAVNEAINHARRTSRSEEYESGITTINRFTPLDQCSEDDLAEQLGEAIQVLPMDYRIVIVLRHYHDFSYREIAEIVDVPEKTVKSRIFSARQQLREILGTRGVER